MLPPAAKCLSFFYDPEQKLSWLTYQQQQHLGSRATSGGTIKSKSSWSCASPGTGARRNIYLSYFFCHYQPLQTGRALYGPSTPCPKCDPTVLSHLFPSSSAGAACGQMLSLGVREAPATVVSLNPKRTVTILNVGVVGEPISAGSAEKPSLNFAACDPPCRCLSSFTR